METETSENNEVIATPVVEETPKAKKFRKPLIITAIIAIVILVLVILVGTSKPMRIHRLVKFTAQVEKEYMHYTDKDLDKAKAQYEKYVRKIERCELNEKQQSKVNELRGECNGYFTQAKAMIILQDFQNAVNAAGDEVKGAIKSMSDDN